MHQNLSTVNTLTGGQHSSKALVHKHSQEGSTAVRHKHSLGGSQTKTAQPVTPTLNVL